MKCLSVCVKFTTFETSLSPDAASHISASRKAAKKKMKKAVKAVSEEVADVLPSAPAATAVQS